MVFSPSSIVIAATLLLGNLLGAAFVKVTANDVDVHSVPTSLVSPAFEKLKLNTSYSLLDALHLSNAAFLASKLADLKTQEAILNIKEAFISQGEHVLKKAQADLKHRLQRLWAVENCLREWEELILREDGLGMKEYVLNLKTQEAQRIITMSSRKRLQKIAEMAPASDQKTAKNGRKEEPISNWNAGHEPEKGDLKEIRRIPDVAFERKNVVTGTFTAILADELKKKDEKVMKVLSALVTPPATPTLQKATVVSVDPK